MVKLGSFRVYLYIGLTIAGGACALLYYPFPLKHAAPHLPAIIIFSLIGLFLHSYPARLNNHELTFTLAIQLFLFIQFGFLIELIVSLAIQLVLLAFFIIKRRLEVKDILVLCATFWCSLLSAAAYHLTLFSFSKDLSVSQPVHPAFAALIAYVIVSFLAKSSFQHFVQWLLQRPRIPLTWEGFAWRALTTLVAATLSLLIWIVYNTDLGLFGAVIVSCPIIAMAYIIRLLKDLEETNEQMKRIHELTTSFAAELDIEKNLDALISTIQKVEQYDICFIFRLDLKENHLFPVRLDSTELVSQPSLLQFSIPVQEGLAERQPAPYKRTFFDLEKLTFYWGSDAPAEFQDLSRTLCVPIQTQERVLGVFMLGCFSGTSYRPKDVTLLEILANHAAAAMESAYTFQRTERRALTDELTGLINYRGFELQLEQQLELAKQERSSLALLMVDLDHFKQVNDRFGHLMGNQVLRSLSQTMKLALRPQDILSRYGGEEFAILLPGTGKAEALASAEMLRSRVAETTLELQTDLDGRNARQTVQVKVTASIGLAVYPLHAEDPLSLVRHADRAMYVGAKQKGRNRVAIYHSG